MPERNLQRSMEQIIDKYLKDLVDSELNKLPVKIEPLMADVDQEADEEWRTWLPIPSRVTDEEIEEIESRIGHKFPQSYRRFLKHKHFYQLDISECSFCPHPVHTWRGSLSAMIFDGYPREFLVEKGRIPFASWSDWGLLCFDTTAVYKDYNYPIVLWDHEASHYFEFKYSDFGTMIMDLDREAGSV